MLKGKGKWIIPFQCKLNEDNDPVWEYFLHKEKGYILEGLPCKDIDKPLVDLCKLAEDIREPVDTLKNQLKENFMRNLSCSEPTEGLLKWLINNKDKKN